MKNKILTIILLIPLTLWFITGCSVNEPPDIRDISGIWKISIGNEYSLNTKHLTINVTETAIIYDNIIFDSCAINDNKLIAVKNYTPDSSFALNLTLTYKENYLVGYEYTKYPGYSDSTYIFGEKIAPLPQDTTIEETDVDASTTE